MGGLFLDWLQAGGLVKDWQIGIGLPFDMDWHYIGGWVEWSGLALDWKICNGLVDW